MSLINRLLGRKTIENILNTAREKNQTEIKIRTQVNSEDITTSLDKCAGNKKIEYLFYVIISVNGSEYKMDKFEWTYQSKYRDNYLSMKKFKLRNYENAYEKAKRLAKEGLKVTVNKNSIEEAKKFIQSKREEIEKLTKECY